MTWGRLGALLALVAILLGLTRLWGAKERRELLADNEVYRERIDRVVGHRDSLVEAHGDSVVVWTRERDSLEVVIGDKARASDAASRQANRLGQELRAALGARAPDLVGQLDTMTEQNRLALDSCWSAFAAERNRCSTWERQAKAAGVVLALSIDSVDTAWRADRDYWKGEALRTEFSLMGWLPEGAIRDIGTVVVCAGTGTLAGVAADSPELGVGLGTGCVVGFALF
jgi:hypothetical protein